MVYNLYKISFDFIQYPFNISVNTIYFINYCNHQSTKQYLSTINFIKANPTRNSYVWTQRGELTHLSIQIPSDQHSSIQHCSVLILSPIPIKPASSRRWFNSENNARNREPIGSRMQKIRFFEGRVISLKRLFN